MSTDSFDLSIEIRAAPPAVHGFLADLHQLRVLHPLIVEIRELPPRPEQPDAKRFRVVDRLALGPLRFRTAYIAELRVASPTEIHGRAWQSPGVKLHAVYHVEATGDGGTRLRESTRVSAPRLLLAWVCKQAKAAHGTTQENLKRHFESDSA